MMPKNELSHALRAAADQLDAGPYGPTYTPEDAEQAGAACVQLCGGDRDQARTLWKLIAGDLGYMPHAAAVALIHAAATSNLVPDVEGPEL